MPNKRYVTEISGDNILNIEQKGAFKSFLIFVQALGKCIY